MRGLAWLARPAVSLLTWSSNLILELFGDRTSFTEGHLSPEELRIMVTEAATSSALDPRAGEVDHIIGYVTAKDILRPAYFIPERMPAVDLLQSMQKKRTPLAIVVDELGSVSGVVTMEDRDRYASCSSGTRRQTESPPVMNRTPYLLVPLLLSTPSCRVSGDLVGDRAQAAPMTADAPLEGAPATTPQDIPGVAQPDGDLRGLPPAGRRLTPPPPETLPASDRIFTVTLPGLASSIVLGTDADALWAAASLGKGQWRERWRVRGPGVAQMVTVGNLGAGPRIFVAWGVGRGFLGAPLVLQSIDPETGNATELWRNSGERNEAAHLSMDDVDRDGQPELAFAYFSSKYMVRARHIEPGGRAIEGEEIRMATSRAYGDLDGDGRVDEVLGRSYGDDRDKPGDLRVDLGKGWIQVPTDKGVRAVLVARLGDDPAPALYFADGWVANYGKEAKAQIKRARWQDGAFQIERVAQSPDEYGFSDLQALDLDGDGKPELVAEGNLRVSAFTASTSISWESRELARLEPVLNTAIARDAAGAYSVLVPARPATRVVPVSR